MTFSSKKKYSKNFFQSIYDFIGIPFRMISPELASRLGLTFINQERWDIVSHYAKGLTLDIGCGDNEFMDTYKGKGYGVDPYFVSNVDVAAKADTLPFKENIFDTATFIACFNHIPDRKKALLETKRILKEGGIIIITMLNPFIGYLNHKLLPWLCADNFRKQQTGEKDGMTYNEMVPLAKSCGLEFCFHQSFFYGMNHVYILKKTDEAEKGKDPAETH